MNCKCFNMCITTKQHYKQITAKGKYIMKAEENKPVPRTAHSTLVQVWVLKEDAAVIRAAAENQRMPLSTFVRAAALDAARIVCRKAAAS